MRLRLRTKSMDITNLSPTSLLVAALLTWTLYLIGLAVYRLHLSPIAKFPGPKLAALSRWYDVYYEVVKKGQFTFNIQNLHKEYGKTAFSPRRILPLITRI